MQTYSRLLVLLLCAALASNRYDKCGISRMYIPLLDTAFRAEYNRGRISGE